MRTSTKTSKRTFARTKQSAKPRFTELELSKMGEEDWGYVRTLSPDSARKMFPGISGLPKKGKLFALFGASGTPIALTDSYEAARGYAAEEELAIAYIH